MANLETTDDLIDYVNEGMGELIDGTSPFEAKTLVQLNRAYREIVAGGLGLEPEINKPVAFPWARAQYAKVVNLATPIDTGTVSVTLGSTAIVFSSAPTPSVTDYHFTVDGEPEAYRIDSHSGGSVNATLDAAYVGTTGATSSYDLFKLRYTFGADVLMLLSPIVAYHQKARHEINIIDKSILHQKWPLSQVQSQFPSRGAVIYDDGAGTITIQFNSYPEEAERIEAEYIAEPIALTTAGSDPIMPIHQRVVIAEYALYYMLLEVDDDRSAGQLPIARAAFRSMIQEARSFTGTAGRDFGRIINREDDILDENDFLRTTDGFIISR